MKTKNRSDSLCFVLVLLNLLLCAFAAGRRTRYDAPDQQFRALFEGFQLVLVDDLSETIPVEQVNSSLLRNRYPSERTLVPGRIYVFRKITDISNEDLGMRTLPQRLTKIGAQVTKAPHSAQDFVYLYIGGPAFRIQFEKDGHVGTLFNQGYRSTSAPERWEELILAYK